jgi:hypothetical protein
VTERHRDIEAERQKDKESMRHTDSETERRKDRIINKSKIDWRKRQIDKKKRLNKNIKLSRKVTITCVFIFTYFMSFHKVFS